MIQTKRGLTIEAYSTGTTRIADPDNSLTWAEGLSFATSYPGGDMDAAFTVKRDIVKHWALKGAQRVVFRQGDRIIYEGYVASLDRMLDEQGEAIRVTAVGGWSHILMNRRWQKWWADQRISEDVWRFPGTAYNAWDKTLTYGELDRNNRLKLLPKNVAFGSSDYIRVSYTEPTGDTVKSVTFDYDLQEGTQNWTAALFGVTGNNVLWSATASGTGVATATLGTVSQTVYFYLQNSLGASQTPPDSGSIYFEAKNITVYSQTGTITPTTIATSLIGHFTELNSGTQYVTNNTNSLVPFVSDWSTGADIITDACSFGDTSNNRWASYLVNSEWASTPDGKPLLRIEVYPPLTDYDYAIRLNEDNIAGAVQITADYEDIWNWIVVQYSDANGWQHWITPDDDATLKDTTSITNYGQRDYILSLGYSTTAVATSNGKRLLAAKKDPQWSASPIPIHDYLRRKGKDPVPTARVRAGLRLKVEEFTSDLTGTDTGLTMLITGTRYDDETGVNTLTFGQPLSPMMTILAPPPRIIESAAGGGDASFSSGGGGGGGKSNLNWKRKLGLKPGTPEWEAASRANWKEKQAMIKKWKAGKKKKG